MWGLFEYQVSLVSPFLRILRLFDYQISRNTSSDARLVSKTLGRTFSVQPLASTVLRSTWALWPIVRIAVLSKRASRSLAQTGFWILASLSSGMATFGPLGDPILDPILELILDPILGGPGVQNQR